MAFEFPLTGCQCTYVASSLTATKYIQTGDDPVATGKDAEDEDGPNVAVAVAIYDTKRKQAAVTLIEEVVPEESKDDDDDKKQEETHYEVTCSWTKRIPWSFGV